MPHLRRPSPFLPSPFYPLLLFPTTVARAAMARMPVPTPLIGQLLFRFSLVVVVFGFLLRFVFIAHHLFHVRASSGRVVAMLMIGLRAGLLGCFVVSHTD